MRILLLFAIAFALSGQGVIQQTLGQFPSARQKHIDAHPGSVEIPGLRSAGGIHMQNADGSRTAILGSGVTSTDDAGVVQLNEPKLHRTDDGWLVTEGGTHFQLTCGATNCSLDQGYKNIVSGLVSGIRFTIPKPTYLGDYTLGFNAFGLPWKVKVTPSGYDLSAVVATSQGSKQYALPFQRLNLPGTIDANGDVVSNDGKARLTRAVMVRADGVRTPCTPWSTLTAPARLAFTCDDTALPAEAFPYVIDPTSSYAADSTYRQFTGCCGWHPPATGGGMQNAVDIDVSQSYSANLLYTLTGFARFDTRTLPAGINIASADFNVLDPIQMSQNQNPSDLVVNYYPCDNWPYTTADYKPTPTGILAATYPGPPLAPMTLPMSNTDNIQRGAYTCARSWLETRSEPAPPTNAANRSAFYASLTITYTLGGGTHMITAVGN